MGSNAALSALQVAAKRALATGAHVVASANSRLKGEKGRGKHSKVLHTLCFNERIWYGA